MTPAEDPGERQRPRRHVLRHDEAVRGQALAHLRVPHDAAAIGDVINIGNREEVTILELAQRIVIISNTLRLFASARTESAPMMNDTSVPLIQKTSQPSCAGCPVAAPPWSATPSPSISS